MIRLIFLAVLLPSIATAEWTPLPGSLSYDASFERCKIDARNVDVAQCDEVLRKAFDLNRAVVAAVQACETGALATCPQAFEDQGLPAIAARIAAGAACDNRNVAEFARLTPLPDDHCITMISDILRDEGVVPFKMQTTCDLINLDCADLIYIQRVLWVQEIETLSDSPLTRLRLDEAWDACLDEHGDTDDLHTCHLGALADIWSDLAQTEQEN